MNDEIERCKRKNKLGFARMLLRDALCVLIAAINFRVKVSDKETKFGILSMANY